MKFSYATGSRPLDGFTIKRGVGIGGFGEVYFALSDAGKEVALKRILRNTDVELRGVSQCMNLKHTHLIHLFDIRYDAAGEAWVVMEFVSGDSLKEVIDRHPQGLPGPEVERWFAQISSGVAYLHDHGIVHRDLKPGNIFTDEGVVKIGDYGLSKCISHSRRHAQTESVGTFHYMAPEIGKGEYGKEIDIYALGVVLYEMLTGRVPFNGESSQEIIMKHLTDNPVLTGVPEPYRSVIEKALAKDPQWRYASVAAMQQDLALVPPAAGPASGPVSRTSASATPPREAHVQTSSPDPYFIDEEPEPIQLGELHDRQSHYRTPAAPVIHIDEHSAGGARTELIRAGQASGAALATVTQEPLMGAVRQRLGGVAHWWNHSLGWAPKGVILASTAVLVVLNFQWVALGGVILGGGYGAYYAAWRMLREPSTAVAYQPAPTGRYQGDSPRMTYVDKTRRVREVLAERSAAERLMELTGSLLLSAGIALVASLTAVAFSGLNLTDGGVGAWSFLAWVAVTAMLGSWAILITAKVWEHRPLEPRIRRLTLLAVGLIVGAGAFFAGRLLEVPLDDFPGAGRVLLQGLYPASLYGENHAPRLPAYLMQFAVLFAAVGWWKQADPLRRRRLSWLAGGVALLAALFLPFPQPWGLLLAGIISLAVQLSSPWLSPARRQQAAEQRL
ncbi:serine/threonine-protein kinase [Lignipirellula cremea]|nr:serine/threonine-protein kinase [Lignipirellula cremea]